ncbi:hypothetical protein ACLB2K_067941 [Fragaria x ananassa]
MSLEIPLIHDEDSVHDLDLESDEDTDSESNEELKQCEVCMKKVGDHRSYDCPYLECILNPKYAPVDEAYMMVCAYNRAALRILWVLYKKNVVNIGKVVEFNSIWESMKHIRPNPNERKGEPLSLANSKACYGSSKAARMWWLFDKERIGVKKEDGVMILQETRPEKDLYPEDQERSGPQLALADTPALSFYAKMAN